MRARVCAVSVMTPLWLPVKEIADTPRAWSAMERSAMLIRSPAVSSMSNSRRLGCEVTFSASATRRSVE